MLDQPFTEGVELTRAATFEIETRPDDKDDRRVRLSFSSEAPCLREFEFGPGWEVLGHGPEEVDLSRLVSGTAPLLKDHRHDLDSMVGTVERVQVYDGKGKALVRFRRSASASEMLARVRAGEVRCVSVGYRVHRYVRSGERDGLPVVRVTRWEPYEISLVAMPADASVGVGRSAKPSGTHTENRKERGMEPHHDTQTRDTGSQATTITAERSRVAEITAIGRRFELPTEDVDAAIADGTSADRFRRMTIDYIGERSATAS